MENSASLTSAMETFNGINSIDSSESNVSAENFFTGQSGAASGTSAVVSALPLVRVVMMG